MIELHPRYDINPPTPVASREACALAETRARVGACDARAWARAVSSRDPVSLLKRRHAHVNRATFKMHELLQQLRLDDAPRKVTLLAEAPGGFLFAAR